MRVSDMAVMMIRNQQYQKENKEAEPVNGSLPPEGHVNPFEDPDLNITGRQPSEWQKLVPVDPQVAGQLKALIKEDFVQRNGMCGTGKQADKQADIIKSYTAGMRGDQKLAAIYSCEQLAVQEANRLSAKIREHNPGWQYGQPFDTGILDQDLDMRA